MMEETTGRERTRRGIIFDMDGLLIDSRRIWGAAEAGMLKAMGSRFDPELAERYRGMNAYDVAATAYEAIRPAGGLERYQRLMREGLIEAYGEGEIVAMPGAVELVKRLRGVGPMAVASGSPLAGIERAMERLGIRECFEVLVSSESVGRGKPAPDVFLKAAEELGVRARGCVVFEDSLVGVQAGVAAGMKVLAVPSMAPEAIGALAWRTYGSLGEVRVEDVVGAGEGR